MKRVNLVALFCVCVTTFCICGCNFLNTYKNTAGDPHESAQGIEDRYTAEEDKIVDFAQNRTDGFYVSHGYGNGGMFDCVWSGDCAIVRDGVMNMSLSSSNGTYYGAEIIIRTASGDTNIYTTPASMRQRTFTNTVFVGRPTV